MIDLNNLEEIKKLDPKDVYGSTGMFADQAQQILDEYYDVDFYGPNEGYKDIKNIVFCGMGGSAYGAYILQSLYIETIKVPVTIVSDYTLPGFVDENSLIFVSSYSGSTEEVLACATAAKAKGLKITGYSSGGKLGEFLKSGYPGFTFNPKFNPSGQPRLATGYMITSALVLLNSLGVISLSKEEIQKAIQEVRDNHEDIKAKAQEIAKKLEGYLPVIFAAQHLVGNAHIMRNQINETSKSFSAFEDIPELNHHLMEGLKYPADKKLMAIILKSEFYSEKHKKRVELTRDVVTKNDISVLEYEAKGNSKLSQALQVLAFGGYLSLYLGLIYGEDPSLIPWVDYFKNQLSK